MMNQRNYGILEGRLVKEPHVFNNVDGSRKVMVRLAVEDNYKRDDKRVVQFIDLEAFVPGSKENLGVYDYIHTGDRVGLAYTVRSNSYTGKDGKKVYGQVLQIQNVDLKGSAKRNKENAKKAGAKGSKQKAS